MCIDKYPIVRVQHVTLATCANLHFVKIFNIAVYQKVFCLSLKKCCD